MSSKSEFQELVNTFISCGISINEDYLPEPSEFGIGDEHSFQYAFIDAVIASNKDIGYFVDCDIYEEVPVDFYKDRIKDLFSLVQDDIQVEYIHSDFDSGSLVETVTCGIDGKEYIWAASHQSSYLDTSVIESVINLINTHNSKGAELVILLGGELAPILYLPISAIEALFNFSPDKGKSDFLSEIVDGEHSNSEGNPPYFKFRFKGGNLHGIQHIYYKSSKNLYAEIDFDNGLADGVYRTYNEDGSIQFHSLLSNNKWQGEVLCYWENGKPFLHLNYDHGIYHGRQLLISREGEILFEGNYSQGIRHGEFLFKKAGGEIMMTVQMVNGEAQKNDFFKMSPNIGTFENVNKVVSIIEEEHFKPPAKMKFYRSEELLELIINARSNNTDQ